MVEVKLRIRELRKLRKWATYDLGEKVGLTGTSISRIETGRQNITLENLSKIAFALGVSLRDLFEGEVKIPLGIPAGVIGAFTTDDYGDPSINHPFPVPLNPLPEGAYDAFVTESGWLVGTERKILDRSDLGRPFVIQNIISPDTREVRFEERQFEDSATGPGFHTHIGDPAWRWIKMDDRRILRKWIVEAEIRYPGKRPNFARFTKMRIGAVDKQAT